MRVHLAFIVAMLTLSAVRSGVLAPPFGPSGNIAQPILMAGQSNEGNENTLASPVGVTPTQGGYILSAWNAQTAVTPISPYPNVGPQPDLAELLVAAGRTPMILRHFANGIGIDSWLPGQPLFDQLLAARQNLESRLGGFNSSRPMVFDWGHGESPDGTNAGLSAAYEGKLRTFLDALDAAWGQTITLIFGMNATFGSVTFRAAIRAAQVAVAAEQPWRIFIDSDSANSNNGLHYDRAGFGQIAPLRANAILLAA